MSKSWRIARYEYSRHVMQKRFFLVALSMPAVIALTIGLVAIAIALGQNNSAVGYVDRSGLLTNPLPAPRRGSSPDNPSVPELVPLIPFETEDAARDALESREIQAYYIVPGDYFETNHVELVYIKPPGENATRQFWDFMEINVLAEIPSEMASRAAAGSNLIVRWPDDAPAGGREFSERTFFNTFLPLIAGIAFVFLLLSVSGYFVGAIIEERENLTVEVVLTSVSPGQLMGGKILGIVGIILTQVVAWFISGGLAYVIGKRILDLGLFQNLSFDLRFLGTMMVIIAPAFVLVAALMATVGAIIAEAQDAQQMVPLLLLPLVVPIWFTSSILNNPNGPLAIGLSLFPLSSVATFSIRLGFVPVPLWQIVASVILTTVCALGAIWLAGQALRLGILRYGKPLKWREIIKRSKNATS